MAKRATRRGKMRRTSRSVRTSVTLSHEVYETLGKLAKQKKVTVAWIIRDAAEKYIGNEWPLFRQGVA